MIYEYSLPPKDIKGEESYINALYEWFSISQLRMPGSTIRVSDLLDVGWDPWKLHFLQIPKRWCCSGLWTGGESLLYIVWTSG